jgi:6-phosphogluconolactonase
MAAQISILLNLLLLLLLLLFETAMALQSRSNVKVFKDKSEIKSYIADFVAEVSSHAINTKGIFTVALSGGSMPELLSSLSEREIGWTDWRVFFADERCVPLEHNESNFKSCQENLFANVPIPSAHIIVIDNFNDPEAAATSYEARMRAIVPDLSLDLVLLGLGNRLNICVQIPL